MEATYKQKLEVLQQQEELIEDEEEQEQKEENARRAKKEEEARTAEALLPDSEVRFQFLDHLLYTNTALASSRKGRIGGCPYDV